MGKAIRGNGQGARYRERTYLHALRLRDDGVPVPEIAKRLKGPSVRTLSRWFSAAGAPAKRRLLNHEEILRDLDTLEPQAVAEKHGCTVDWIYTIRQRHVGGTRKRPNPRAVLRELRTMTPAEVAMKHECAVSTIYRIRRNAKRGDA